MKVGDLRQALEGIGDEREIVVTVDPPLKEVDLYKVIIEGIADTEFDSVSIPVVLIITNKEDLA